MTDRPSTISDALSMVPAGTAASRGLAVLDQLQAFPPAEQVAGAAMVMLMLCRRYRVSPADALYQTSRRIEDALGGQLDHRPGDHTRAIREYLKEEL